MTNIFTKEWINNVPKIINENGCWIPIKKSGSDGYVRISIGKGGRDGTYSLHRIVMCLYYEIDYNNLKIDTRHSKDCDRACFFHEHLKPGSSSDNVKDSILHGTHANASKKYCSKCGNQFKIRIIKTGWNKGKIMRECIICKSRRNSRR